MSKNVSLIIEELEKRGFTSDVNPFELFYWPKDGWYVHSDHTWHDWLGQNTKHCIECIRKGDYDKWLGREIKKH